MGNFFLNCILEKWNFLTMSMQRTNKNFSFFYNMRKIYIASAKKHDSSQCVSITNI